MKKIVFAANLFYPVFLGFMIQTFLPFFYYYEQFGIEYYML
jgi:hypothetical protein